MSSLLTPNLAIISREGDDTAYMATPSLSTAHIMPFPAQAHPSHSGHLGRTLKYCRNCEIKYEDFDEFGRHGRVARFCCFCGDRFSRAVLGYVDHRVQTVPLVGISLDHDGPTVDLRSRSPVRYVGGSGRRRSRSRSPDTRIREDVVERIRSPLPQVRGLSHQHLIEPDALPHPHRDLLEDIEYGLTQRSTRVSTIRRRRTRNKGASEAEVLEPMVAVKASPSGRPDTPHTYQEPIENIHRKHAASPVDINIHSIKRQYDSARELSNSPPEFHATRAKLREDISPVPNVRSAQEQRRAEYQRMNLRWDEEELDQDARYFKKKVEKAHRVQIDEDMIKKENDPVKLPQTVWEHPQAKHQEHNLRFCEEEPSQSAKDLPDEIEEWEVKKEKKVTMVDLTLEDD